MSKLDRFTVSLDTELLAAFDRYIADHGYENRSEAVRDMIRDLLLTARLQRSDEPVSAVLAVVCDDREGDAVKRLRACLAGGEDIVAGSLHTPVDKARETVAIALRGTAAGVVEVSDQIQALRGVTHGRFLAVPRSE